jgi:hypothetical protein
MTKKEANRILAILNTNYPDTFKDLSDDAYRMKVNLWASAFQTESFEMVSAAVMAYMSNSTERFAPNIGKIKEQIRTLTHPGELTEGEAWAKVQAAIRNSGYGAAEEFAKLPPLVQKVVGSPSNLREWGLMPSDIVNSVVASNFQRGYRTMQAREAAEEKTPLEVRQAFAALTKPMTEALPDPAPAKALPEPQVVTGEAMRSAIEELRAAVGEVTITEEKKAAALERLRGYGKEQT